MMCERSWDCSGVELSLLHSWTPENLVDVSLLL